MTAVKLFLLMWKSHKFLMLDGKTSFLIIGKWNCALFYVLDSFLLLYSINYLQHLQNKTSSSKVTNLFENHVGITMTEVHCVNSEDVSNIFCGWEGDKEFVAEVIMSK